MSLIIEKIRGFIVCDVCLTSCAYEAEECSFDVLQIRVIEALPVVSSKVRAWMPFKWKLDDDGDVTCPHCALREAESGDRDVKEMIADVANM